MSQFKDLPAHLWTKQTSSLGPLWRIRWNTQTWSGFRTEQEASSYLEAIQSQLIRNGVAPETTLDLVVEEMK